MGIHNNNVQRKQPRKEATTDGRAGRQQTAGTTASKQKRVVKFTNIWKNGKYTQLGTICEAPMFLSPKILVPHSALFFTNAASSIKSKPSRTLGPKSYLFTSAHTMERKPSLTRKQISHRGKRWNQCPAKQLFHQPLLVASQNLHHTEPPGHPQPDHYSQIPTAPFTVLTRLMMAFIKSNITRAHPKTLHIPFMNTIWKYKTVLHDHVFSEKETCVNERKHKYVYECQECIMCMSWECVWNEHNCTLTFIKCVSRKCVAWKCPYPQAQ